MCERTKKRFHALKFHTRNVDMASWAKADMARDTTNMPASYRAEWENLPKQGQGSEFGREAKELARRKKFGFMPRRVQSIEDLPWLIKSTGSEKEQGKERE